MTLRKVSSLNGTLIHKVCKYDINIRRENVVWRFPCHDWVKVNFDGAAKGNPGKFGGGGVIRNTHGVCIAAIASPFVVQNNHVAEAQAMLKCLQLAQGFKFKKKWLEGDSLNIIQAIKGTSSPSWNIFNIIESAKKLLNDYDSVFISHTLREGNKIADLLANEEVYLEEDAKYIGEAYCKKDVRAQLLFDRVHGSS